ncbi:chemotaxis protein CheX [bacterium]|nr:chemotaxis protein CheX [bacterium]
MQAEILNEFVGAATTVLSDHFGISISGSRQPKVVSGNPDLDPVMVVLRITGELDGHFCIGCSEGVALEIVRAMMMNPDIAELDEMSMSALSELANMIAGTALPSLEKRGHCCNLEPPQVYRRNDNPAQLDFGQLIMLPVISSAGDISFYIALSRGTEYKGAYNVN